MSDYQAASHGLAKLFLGDVPLGEGRLANYEPYKEERIPRYFEHANLGYVTGATDSDLFYAKLNREGKIVAEAIADSSSGKKA